MTQTPPLFSTSNKHTAGSGTPPQVDGDAEGRYHGYFENEHGEQAVFVYDRHAEQGTLWMGDQGWETSVEVVSGVAQDTVLNEAEALWLRACWLAATSFAGQDGR